MHSSETITALFARLSGERNAGIDAIHTHGDRSYSAMEWDFNHAPRSTNWKMLEMIGIDPATATLPEILSGLSVWNINVVIEPGCEDSYVLDTLRTKILVEEITMIAPTPDLQEFLHINNPATVARLA